MHLTDDQISLIRDRYDEMVRTDAERLSELFYDDLFTRLPKAKAMFGDDLAAQGMRFMTAIGFLLQNLDDEEELNKRLELLANGHAPFGLRREDYRQMEESLIDTLKHAFKARWTDDRELAWRAAFGQICERMIERTEALRWKDTESA